MRLAEHLVRETSAKESPARLSVRAENDQIGASIPCTAFDSTSKIGTTGPRPWYRRAASRRHLAVDGEDLERAGGPVDDARDRVCIRLRSDDTHERDLRGRR